MSESRYARQELIDWWDQRRLLSARVLVVGQGALGNEVVKNLVLLGVGHLLLVDMDTIESSNLSRAVLFRPEDVGRPKVQVAAAAAYGMNPESRIWALHGDVMHDLGLGCFRHSDLVIGCLDNLAARLYVSQCCSLAGTPYLDGAMWSMGGEVRWFVSGQEACFDCTLDSDRRARAHVRHSCAGMALAGAERAHTPTVATTTAVIGGLLCQEAVKHLCGRPASGSHAIVYNGLIPRLHRAEIPRNPRCPSSHDPYQDVILLRQGPGQITSRQLLQIAAVHGRSDALHVELGRDFLIALCCPRCGKKEAQGDLLCRVPEIARKCPECGAARERDVVRAVAMADPKADVPLGELGVPRGEIVAIGGMPQVQLFELDGGQWRVDQVPSGWYSLSKLQRDQDT